MYSNDLLLYGHELLWLLIIGAIVGSLRRGIVNITANLHGKGPEAELRLLRAVWHQYYIPPIYPQPIGQPNLPLPLKPPPSPWPLEMPTLPLFMPCASRPTAAALINPDWATTAAFRSCCCWYYCWYYCYCY
ncbi:hypothetical protein VaNZ11_009164 [Volvox africanus]|uniref:Uncharacterized protein n=1 Tax=Volvox africanus TaxID=51714 RepID=A0ABQ5S6S7_9CHLO|nr:hypothetical protein VaNZ11_009164 [Volvox africanus]